MTQLTIEIEQMSQYCVKCALKIMHDASICSKNYVDSAKGMEASGALAMATRLYDTGLAIVGVHVGDDGSSMHSVLRRCYQYLIISRSSIDFSTLAKSLARGLSPPPKDKPRNPK